MCACCYFSRVWLFSTLWTIAYQAPLSMGFSRQECLSGLPCPPPGDLPDPGIKARFPGLQADSLLSEPPGKPKDSGVNSLSLLHCRWILYHLSHQGSPRIMEWMAYPSCTAGGFFTCWVTQEAWTTDYVPLQQISFKMFYFINFSNVDLW